MNPISKHDSVHATSAESFDQYMRRYPELYHRFASILRQYIRDENKPLHLADIGMGTGILLEELTRQFPQAYCIGIDQSSAMINQAKQHLKKNQKIDIIQGTVEALPLASQSMDAVTCRFSMYSWNHPEKGLQEIYRILRPNGFFLLEILNREYPGWKQKLVKLHMTFKRAASTVISYHFNAYKDAYTLDEVLLKLKKAGFKQLSTKGKATEWKYVLVASK